MALDMRKKMIELKQEWDDMGIPSPLRARMGINTGFCTVGNFGSEERLDYTIVGGPVNLASRLESHAPVDEILISYDTYTLVKEEIQCEPFGEIKAKGFSYPVMTYVVKGLKTKEVKEPEFHAALEGFNLSINLAKLNYADKLHARQILENALKRI
jgi:class 3 adenylate cyclase